MKSFRMYRVISFIAALVLVFLSVSSCGGNGGEEGAPQTNETESEEQTTEKVVVPKDYCIYIDPGHGFADPGAESPYIDKYEKDITIVYAKKLCKILMDRGYEAYLTHDGKTFPKSASDTVNNVFDVKERTAYVNSEGADYFISIHCNTYADKGAEKVDGARIYYSEDAQYDVDTIEDASNALAESIKDAFPKWREPKVIMTSAADSYYVTHWIKACSLLLEIGYMTNEADANNMIDDDWTEKMVNAIADGIDAFYEDQ